MSVKFIAITQRLAENDNYFELREALSTEWGLFFKEHLDGFLPLPLSYEISFEKYAKDLQESLAGVILSGGNDLNALNPSGLSLMRDDYENEIISYALESNLPLLGICRGAQKIAEFFGSKLHKLDNHTSAHKIFLENDSKSEFLVNSFHNYGIKALNEPLEILARAQDLSIEAFKHTNKNIFAMMWHIEREKGLEYDAILNAFKSAIKGSL